LVYGFIDIGGSKLGKEKNKKTNDYLDKIYSKRLNDQKALINDYDSLYEYMIPFLEADKKMKKLACKIKNKMHMLPMDDFVLLTANMTQNVMFINDLFRITNSKKNIRVYKNDE